MSLLSDLLLDALDLVGSGLGIGPFSDRGRLQLLTFLGIAAASLSVWLMMISENPLNAPAWGFTAIVGVTIVGTAGVAISGLHLLRHRSVVALAVLCLAVNAVALLIIWMPLLGK